jgi:hypothetical protein
LPFSGLLPGLVFWQTNWDFEYWKSTIGRAFNRINKHERLVL